MQATTNYGTVNYGDQGGRAHGAHAAGTAMSAEQAFAEAAKLRAAGGQATLAGLRSDNVHREVRGEPWAHRPGYGGKLGGGDPDLDLGLPWSSGTRTHPTGIPRRLRDPEYRLYHGVATRHQRRGRARSGREHVWHHNLTSEDVKSYTDMDINAVRLAFQWDSDDPNWDRRAHPPLPCPLPCPRPSPRPPSVSQSSRARQSTPAWLTSPRMQGVHGGYSSHHHRTSCPPSSGWGGAT